MIAAFISHPSWAGVVTPPPLQMAGVTAFGSRESPLLNGQPATLKAAGITVFQPAPMPDQDIDPPHGASAHGPSLTPALFSHKAEFEGDGYSRGSDLGHEQDKRRQPAAGLNLSVPVR